MKRRLFWAILPVLASCASPPSLLSDAPQWSGRLALQVHSTPPEQFQAAFELRGSAQSGELQLLSPIGTVLARLIWTAEQAVLEQGAQQRQAANVQELLRAVSGTEVPVTALFDWLAGQATAEAGWQADLSQHAQGRITARREQPEPAAVLRIALTP